MSRPPSAATSTVRSANEPRHAYAHLYEIVQQRAAVTPGAVAIGGQQGLGWKILSSQQLLDLVDRLAVELAAEGVQPGDRIVLWVPNHWRTPVFLFALWKLGAVIIPFDREMNPNAAADILALVEARCVIVGYDERPAWVHRAGVVQWWEPGTRDGSAAADWTIPDERQAAIFFTSGTTGNPKGCVITHANLLSQVEAGFERIPLDGGCRLASILPLSHLFELTCGLLYPLAAGAAVHYIPSRRAPDILRVLSEQRITHMMAVPQLLTMMGQALEQQLQGTLPRPVYAGLRATARRLSFAGRRRLYWKVHKKLGGHLRLLAAGGAPLSTATHQMWEGLGVRVTQGYGASECSPIIACGATDGSTPAGSVGRSIRGVEVKLTPEGELLVHGPNVMAGYWHDPERTAEVIRNGWYHTGDLATIDQTGNIWLSGRARDLIVLPSGMKVWPQDVEDILRAETGVLDAVVVQVPRAGGSASLHAYLLPVASSDRSIDLSTLVGRCNGRLAQHQRLATASWWAEPDFPRTSTLKVRRHLLPMPERAGVVQLESALAADDPVAQVVAGAARVGAIQPGQTLGDLGLDSLGLVELALALEEKTGKVVADSDLRLDMNIDAVRDLIARAPALDDERRVAQRGREPSYAEQPMWPYTWGRVLRGLSFGADLIYGAMVTKTVILGAEYLANLPARVILAGTHHSMPDMPLVRHAFSRSVGQRRARRLVPAISASVLLSYAPWASWLGVVTLGLYPLFQHEQREASLRGLARVAAAGNDILIFPQGAHIAPERERADDPSARFRPGVGHLVAVLDMAVVPFGLAGTEALVPADPDEFHVWLRALRRVPRGPLVIAFGAPLVGSPGESPDAFAARLQGVCYELTRQAERSLTRL